MRIAAVLLGCLLTLLPARMQDASAYQLAWITEKAPYQWAVYDPTLPEQTVHPLGVSLSESFDVIDGRYIFSPSSGENSDELLIIDLVAETNCTASYMTEISLNTTAPLVVAAPGGHQGVYEINPTDCTFTRIAGLPDGITPHETYGIHAGDYLAVRVRIGEANAVLLLNRASQTFQQLNEAPLSPYVTISFSPDQRYLLYGDADQSYLYTLETGSSEHLSAEFQSPYFEGDYLVTSSQGSLAIWAFADGEIGDQLVSDDSIFYDHTTRFSPSGRYAFYRDAETAYTHIVDLTDVTRSWVVELTGSYSSRWADDESALLIEHGDEEALYTYTLATGTLTRVIASPNGYAAWLDSSIFFEVDYASQQATYYRYEADTQAVIYSLPYNASSIATMEHQWSPDGKTLLIEVAIFNPRSLPEQCAILLEVATGETSDVGCADFETQVRHFFWMPS